MSFMPDWGYDWNRRITYRLSGLFSWYCQTLSRNRLECNFRGTIGTRRLREKKQERETVGETVITKVSAKSHLMSFPLTFLVSSEACDHAVCLISSVVRKRIRDKHTTSSLWMMCFEGDINSNDKRDEREGDTNDPTEGGKRKPDKSREDVGSESFRSSFLKDSFLSRNEKEAILWLLLMEVTITLFTEESGKS